MDDSTRTDRWMALGGPAFLILFVATFVLEGSTPAEKASGAEVVKHYADHLGANGASVFVLGPAVAALMLFTASLRTALDREGGAGRKLLQYGAVIYAVGIVFSATLQLGLVTASDHDQANVAQTLNVLQNDAWIPVVVGVAVMLFGAGLAVLRTDVLPRWMGWVAVVVGAISILGPGGFAGFLVAPVWIAVAGVLLYLRKPVGADVVV